MMISLILLFFALDGKILLLIRHQVCCKDCNDDYFFFKLKTFLFKWAPINEHSRLDAEADELAECTKKSLAASIV